MAERRAESVERGRQPLWPSGSSAQRVLREQVQVKPDDSVALVDWVTAGSFWSLLKGGRTSADPFISVAQLATMVAALIFYDRVVVLDSMNISAGISEVLGTTEIVRGLSPTLTHPPDDDLRFGSELDDLLCACLADLNDGTRADASWIHSLRRRWEQLLPGLSWPEHTVEVFEHEFGVDVLGRHWTQQKYPLTSLFVFNAPFLWTQDLPENLRQVVLANDVRALYYMRLAANIRDSLDEYGAISVRYVGGPLRTPMLGALAELAAASLKPEEGSILESWLDEDWHALHPGEPLAIRLPLWLEAVLAKAPTRQHIPEVILEYRAMATRLRRRRTELERQIAQRNRSSLGRMVSALSDDAEELMRDTTARVDAAIASVDVGVRMLTGLPTGPKLALSMLNAAAGHERVARWKLRLFHPELRCIYELGRGAEKLGNALPLAFERFALQKGEAHEPLQFLSRLGNASAVV